MRNWARCNSEFVVLLLWGLMLYATLEMYFENGLERVGSLYVGFNAAENVGNTNNDFLYAILTHHRLVYICVMRLEEVNTSLK